MRKLTLIAFPVALVVASCGSIVQTPPSVTPKFSNTHSALPTPAGSGVSCRIVDGKTPRSCTPGALNLMVTQQTLKTTVCKPGWTATIRPPASYTTHLKEAQLAKFGLKGMPNSAVEEDHLISLELGGDPRAEQNLWPEPWDGSNGAHAKDAYENAERRALCSGKKTLSQVQSEIVQAWTY